jgi:hypothetical protein
VETGLAWNSSNWRFSKTMKSKIYFFIFFVGFWITTYTAQSTNISSITFADWGKQIQGVQMSIALTNNVIPYGSSFTIFIEMKNSSTNIISMGESIPETDFIVSLADDSGRMYQITRSPFAFTRMMQAKLNPGQTRNWTLFAEVNKYYETPGIVATKKNVPIGDYTLVATRKFGIGNNFFKIESNHLTIQIK